MALFELMFIVLSATKKRHVVILIKLLLNAIGSTSDVHAMGGGQVGGAGPPQNPWGPFASHWPYRDTLHGNTLQGFIFIFTGTTFAAKVKSHRKDKHVISVLPLRSSCCFPMKHPERPPPPETTQGNSPKAPFPNGFCLGVLWQEFWDDFTLS